MRTHVRTLAGHNRDVAEIEFAEGQRVALYPTIASERGGSVASGTRGIVQAIDPDRTDDAIYLVGFLASERLTGEQTWLRAVDLFPA